MNESSSHNIQPLPSKRNFEQDFPDYFHRMEKSIFESPATRRNFHVTPFELSDGKLELLLETEKSQIGLTQFLPKDWTFHMLAPDRNGDQTNYSCLRNKKRVVFPGINLPYRGSVLSLLHEISHSQIPVKELKIDPSQANDMWTEAAIKLLILSQLYSSSPSAIESLGDIPVENLLPNWMKDKIHAREVESERNAWSGGLLIARKLERRGFNVLGEFENVDQIHKYITFCLGTYEYKRRSGENLIKPYFPSSDNEPKFIKYPQEK